MKPGPCNSFTQCPQTLDPGCASVAADMAASASGFRRSRSIMPAKLPGVHVQKDTNKWFLVMTTLVMIKMVMMMKLVIRSSTVDTQGFLSWGLRTQRCSLVLLCTLLQNTLANQLVVGWLLATDAFHLTLKPTQLRRFQEHGSLRDNPKERKPHFRVLTK